MRLITSKIITTTIILTSLLGCNQTKNKNTEAEIEIVKEFLTTSNPQDKLQLVRKNSDYLKNNSISKLINKLPESFIEIKPSQEIIDDKEEIIEVVIKRVLVGGKYVNMFHNYFVLNENGQLKIDLDASFFKDTTISYMSKNNIEFSKRKRVYVNNFTTKDEHRIINNKKVLLDLFDEISRENILVLKSELADQLKKILSKNEIAHLILELNFNRENDMNIVADSLIQVGWIVNK